MSYSIRWDICSLAIDTPDEAMAFIDEQSELFNNWGTRGSTMWIGPDGTKRREMPLRIDLEPESGAAAIRWLPDNLVAVGDDNIHHGSIKVAESSDRELVTIPAELVRADIALAKAAAAEYVNTGQRPASLTWQPINA